MKLKKEDLDRINKTIRRNEHLEIIDSLKSKVVKSKKIYNRKKSKKDYD